MKVSRSLLGLLSKPLVQLAIVAMLAAALPYFLPGVSVSSLEFFGLYAVAIPIIVATIVAVEWARRRSVSRGARRFWFFVNAALACWLGHWLLMLAMQENDYLPWVQFAADVLNLAYYLLLFLAAVVRPDAGFWATGSTVARLRMAGALLVLFVAVVYFIAIPVQLGSAGDYVYQPTLFTYVALDVLLVAAFVSLWRESVDHRWKTAYGLMSVFSVSWLVLDGIETAMYVGLVPEAFVGTPWDLLWLAPYVPVVAAAQMQVSRPVAAMRPTGDDADIVGSTRGSGARLLIALTALLPIAHIAISAAGAADPSTQRARDLLILFAVVAMAGLALAVHGRIDSLRAISADVLLRELERRRAASARFLVARDEERGYIARELHEDIREPLTDVSLTLSSVRHRVDGDARAALDRVADAVVHTMGRVGDLSSVLRASRPGEPGIVIALRGLCSEFAQQGKMNIVLNHDGDEDEIPTEIQVAAFRTVREALSNAVTHAGAAEARVDVTIGDGNLLVEIRDRGRGFIAAEAGDAGGKGIDLMRQITEQYGGRFSLTTAPDAGVRVAAEIPYRARVNP